MKYTFIQFKNQYPNDEACLDAILARRYPNLKHCPVCGVESELYRVEGRRAYVCTEGCHVYPCAGTIFEHSPTSLTLWFHAMYLLTSTRKGVSAKELERQLGVTYKCAWRIGHQLRILMAARDKANNPGLLKGHVEVDETYVGGKRKGGKRGRGAEGKTIVFGMLEREGSIKGQVVPNVKGNTLRPIIGGNVKQGSIISSDEMGGYNKLAEEGYQHGVVNHSAEQYVNGIHHTQGVDGFWSHLKRGISSTHVAVSKKHMQKYVDEFAFRYNNRHAPEDMFQRMLAQVSRSRLDI